MATGTFTQNSEYRKALKPSNLAGTVFSVQGQVLQRKAVRVHNRL